MALQILALMVVAGAFLPLVRHDGWMVRGWDFPRLQLLFFALVIAAALVAWGVSSWFPDGAVLAAVLAAVLTLAFWMRPYTPLARREVLAADDHPCAIRLMISNVLMTNRDDQAFLRRVRECDPDLILALETDTWWQQRIARLATDYPHAVEIPQDDTYGMILRSRLPLLDPKVETLVRDHIPSIHTGLELRDGSPVHLHAVHPKPPFPDEDTSSTDRDAELLIVGQRAKEHGGPTIVIGDLNDVAWSRTTKLFQKISGLLDPRIGRGFYCTFHADHWWMRWPLDHVFMSDHFQLRSLKRLGPIGSDHFPILVDLAYLPREQHRQDAPRPDGDDKDEAEEKIEAPDKDAAASGSASP